MNKLRSGVEGDKEIIMAVNRGLSIIYPFNDLEYILNYDSNFS